MRVIKKVFLVVMVVGFVLLAYMNIETRWLRTRNIDISSNDIPVSFQKFKIVFVSDIHHGPYLFV